MATKMSPRKAITHFGVRLLQELPLDNVTFLNMVDKAGLLPLGNKAKIQVIPDNASKVDHFKSKILEPGADIYLPRLLDVMDASGDPVAIALATDIREATGLTKSDPKPTPKPTPKPGVPGKSVNGVGDDVPDDSKFNYHQLLWQELNKKFCDATSTIFVMAVGQQPEFCDYDITAGHAELAAQKTFELVNHTIPCVTNYSLKGSPISEKWNELLQIQGPKAGPEHQPAFEEAKRVLFVDYEKKKRTELHQDYCDKKIALKQKELQIEKECRDKYFDQWKVNYDRRLEASKEYIEFQIVEKEAQPHLDAIEVWQHGPLVHDLNRMKKVLKENERIVYDYSQNRLEYYHVSLQPANWYQWFGKFQDEGKAWMQINVDSNNDDADLAALYKNLSGSVTTYHSLNNRSDVKISFKVRVVTIDRPWLNLSILNKNYKISGVEPGSWSTGELDASNKGSFPLLTTKMIVAKDITITTSTEMEHEAIDDACSLFGVGSDSYKTISNSSIELKGTQVIGYVCALVPKFPH